MNTKLKKNKTKKVILICTLISFIFNACSNSKYGEKVVTKKNWVNWEVTFKEKISEEERNKALLSIDKYILDYLYKEKPVETKVFYVNISHIPQSSNSDSPGLPHKYLIRIQVDLGEKAGQQAVPGPHPTGPGPVIPPEIGEIKQIL